MDYLESASVIPRSVCSRILHVSGIEPMILFFLLSVDVTLLLLQEYRVPEDRNRAVLDFIHGRARDAFKPFIEALYLSGECIRLDDVQQRARERERRWPRPF